MVPYSGISINIYVCSFLYIYIYIYIYRGPYWAVPPTSISILVKYKFQHSSQISIPKCLYSSSWVGGNILGALARGQQETNPKLHPT